MNVAESRQTDIPCRFSAGQETTRELAISPSLHQMVAMVMPTPWCKSITVTWETSCEYV